MVTTRWVRASTQASLMEEDSATRSMGSLSDWKITPFNLGQQKWHYCINLPYVLRTLKMSEKHLSPGSFTWPALGMVSAVSPLAAFTHLLKTSVPWPGRTSHTSAKLMNGVFSGPEANNFGVNNSMAIFYPEDVPDTSCASETSCFLTRSIGHPQVSHIQSKPYMKDIHYFKAEVYVKINT